MEMEAQRRLSIISSHLRHFDSSNSNCLSQSRCNEVRIRVSDNDGSLVKECVFCMIIRGVSPAYKLYEDEKCLCILDTSPLSRGHSLLIPKLHYPSLDATPPLVIAAMCSKIPFISNAIIKATGADSFNLLVNNGAAAGQVIFHTHIHIIPRRKHDCLWASESLRRLSLKLDEEASQLAERIRGQISSSSSNMELEEDKSDEGSNLAGNYRD